jgi:RimJ/RimL family protein N-acetyltransferase/SAM-dependent methyltransferase
MDRLNLSELVEADLEFLDRWHQDPRVWRYLTARPATGEALRVAFLRLSQDSHCVMRAIRNESGFLGYGLFSNIRMDVRRAEVELVLGPEFQGRGLGGAALRELMDLGFGKLGLRRVEAHVTRGNEASRRMLEASGFQHEGTLREAVLFDGEPTDQLIYARLDAPVESVRSTPLPVVRTSEAYYDDLAGDYHLMYRDWEKGVAWNAQVLDALLREHFGPGPLRLLDAACGIGTQVLGLAALGHCVSGSDLSARSVERARSEAASRGVDIDFRQADMVSLADSIPGPFDVVLACDNAIPHLLNEAEILQAFRQFHRCTTDTGGCLVSVRDYEDFDLKVPAIHPRHVHPAPGGADLLFDVRRPDGDCYDFDTFLVEDRGGATATARVLRGGRYFRVGIATLQRLMREAGFAHCVVIRDVYHQPVLVGLKMDSGHPEQRMMAEV